MFRRLRHPVLGVAAFLCFTQFLYQLLELSSVNIAHHHREQNSVQDGLQLDLPEQIHAIADDKNPLQGDLIWARSNASKNQLTHRVLTSLDKIADASPNRPHGSTSRLYTSEQHQALTNLSSMAPSGTVTRLPANCASVGFPRIEQSSPVWQTVVPDQSYVFSAFIERRLDRHEVKLIGTADTRKTGRPHYCYVWYRNSSFPVIVPVNDEIVPETHQNRFVVFIYKCEVNSVMPNPYAVSLVQERCDPVNNILPITSSRTKARTRITFTICVSALHNNFNDADRLVEFVEIHRIFGAERFVFYNMSIGQKAQMYLEFYKLHGTVEVIPWKLPKRVDAHYHAQLATLNDCLYRYMYRSKYIAFLDIDEVLVPRLHGTWNQLMSSLMHIPYSAKLCAFVFQCVFFRTDWPDNPTISHNTDIQYYNIISLMKTKREPNAWPHLQRSKLIVNPRKVDIIGIHNIWKPLRDYMEYDVPNRTAVLHHYRRWDDTNNHNWVIDDTMFTYATSLLERLHLVRKQVRRRYAS